MPRAAWNGAVLAESDVCEKVEGNFYFPPQSINRQFFKDSSTTSICGWKGEAHYYTIEVDGNANKDAAWYYPDPKTAASNIKGYIAFWKGVTVDG